MKLKSISYSEFPNEPQEWVLNGLSVGMKTLLVGKNASGKTRTLNLLDGIAKIFSGLSEPLVTGAFDCHFEGEGQEYKYHVACKEGKVVEERLVIDGIEKITRSLGGIGKIYADVKGEYLDFQTPESEFAIVARRDSIQHKYIEPLYEWGSMAKCYHFGASLAQANYVMLSPSAPPVNERDENAVAGIFKKGQKEFPGDFETTIVRDMAAVGYDIDSVCLDQPYLFKYNPLVLPQILGLCVKEKSRKAQTDQQQMSAGMFRVLAILIHINYLVLKKSMTCILIDDIGEGLDFERSSQLIRLLREKAEQASFQLVMSTNDRFVMDEVPLDEWTVLQRSGGEVKVRNIDNSRAAFEEFKFTGLSNFSFFELNLVDGSLQEERDGDSPHA